MAQKKGVFIVNLISTQGINHPMSVDMGKRHSLDGDEEYPMVLNEESVKCCVGDGISMKKTTVRKLKRKPESIKRSSSGREHKEPTR